MTVLLISKQLRNQLISIARKKSINRNTRSASAEADADPIYKLLRFGLDLYKQSLNNEFLVELRGIEPLSEISSTLLSSTTVIEILFPYANPQ